MVEGPHRTCRRNRFHADANYFTKGAQFAHGTVMSVGETFTGGEVRPAGAGLPHHGLPAEPRAGLHQLPSPAGCAQPGDDFVRHVNPQNPRGPGGPGDWDTGMGDQKDGAYINKPDEGDSALRDTVNGVIRIPYNLGYGAGYASANQTYFSPESAGPLADDVWLHPHRRAADDAPGRRCSSIRARRIPRIPALLAPKDELLADLFWMPVVEPWAISQPFATAGKINMNYQIMPFTYIKRQSGLYARA